MIDINELRPAVEAVGLNAISMQEVLELFDRLEAVEEERDALRAELTDLRNSMAFRTSLIGRIEAEREDLYALIAAVKKQVNAEFRLRMKKEIECNALCAKVEAMERQEPVGRALLCVRCSTPFDGEHYCPACGHHTATEEAVYAIPGAQPAPSFADAYQGAMEDVAIWKKRALEAEDLSRKFVAEINGPAYMGEPAQPAPSVPEITIEMEHAFYEKVTVTRVGSIVGLAEGIKAAMLAAAPEKK